MCESEAEKRAQHSTAITRSNMFGQIYRKTREIPIIVEEQNQVETILTVATPKNSLK